MHCLIIIILCCVWTSLLSAGALAQQACLQQARDGYEEIYCQVQATAEGAGPSLADFRRNPPETQALLLRRPASRLGLSLPAPDRSRPSPMQEASVAGAGPTPAPAVLRKPSGAYPARAVSAVNRPGIQHGQTSCELDGNAIYCGEAVFELATNQANHQLSGEVLAETNRLTLQPYQGEVTDEKALRNYLIDAYQVYIEKMLGIGLGASTMSFTKFYYTYQTLQEQGADFSQRMEQMFNYLKRDKAAMAVKSRYTSELPSDMKYCDRLGEALIVCDEDEWNWVYKKIGKKRLRSR